MTTRPTKTTGQPTPSSRREKPTIARVTPIVSVIGLELRCSEWCSLDPLPFVGVPGAARAWIEGIPPHSGARLLQGLGGEMIRPLTPITRFAISKNWATAKITPPTEAIRLRVDQPASME